MAYAEGTQLVFQGACQFGLLSHHIAGFFKISVKVIQFKTALVVVYYIFG